MAKSLGVLSIILLLLVSIVGLASSADPPAVSPPSPAPNSNPNSPDSSPSLPPSLIPDAPSSSPPSPPPETESPPPSSPESSPAPTSDESSSGSTPTPSPAPSPSDVSDVSHSGDMNDEEDGPATPSSGGMSSGKKAGIAVGVIAAVCLVGVGGLVYKKRQDNIRRSNYGYAARREIL